MLKVRTRCGRVPIDLNSFGFFPRVGWRHHGCRQRRTGAHAVHRCCNVVIDRFYSLASTSQKARIAEEAGACAVMALERVPADIRAVGGVARMASARFPSQSIMVLDRIP